MKKISKLFADEDPEVERCRASDEANLQPLLTTAANASGVAPINANSFGSTSSRDATCSRDATPTRATPPRDATPSRVVTSIRNSGAEPMRPLAGPIRPLNPVQHPRALKLTMPSDATTPTASTASTPSLPTTSAEPTRMRFRRSDKRQRRLNTELLEAIQNKQFEEFERLLNNGANPNATCRLDLVSACHMAAMHSGDFLQLLIKKGAERHRQDRLGRTPLHLAAWMGNARQVAVLLDFPEEFYCDDVIRSTKSTYLFKNNEEIVTFVITGHNTLNKRKTKPLDFVN